MRIIVADVYESEDKRVLCILFLTICVFVCLCILCCVFYCDVSGRLVLLLLINWLIDWLIEWTTDREFIERPRLVMLKHGVHIARRTIEPRANTGKTGRWKLDLNQLVLYYCSFDSISHVPTQTNDYLVDTLSVCQFRRSHVCYPNSCPLTSSISKFRIRACLWREKHERVTDIN